MNKSKNQKSKEYIEIFCNYNSDYLKIKLKKYFNNLRIYCEIFNGIANKNQCFSSKLKEYNSNISKNKKNLLR